MNPLEALLVGMLESAGNLALGLDPLSQVRLSALEGSTVRFEILMPGSDEPHPLTLRIADGALHFEPDGSGTPNTIVHGSLPDIVALLGGPEAGGGEVRIQGDETLLEELGTLLTGYQPDLAGPLGQVLGEQLADQLLGAAEAGIALLRSATEVVSHSAARTVQQSFLGSREFAAARDRIDDLRLRTDRLAARIHLLETAGSPEGP